MDIPREPAAAEPQTTEGAEAETPKRKDDGFEFQGTFYRYRVVVDHPKDMQIIDRLTAMPMDEFVELLDDEEQASRGGVILALMGCSLRSAHPDWSVERIVRTINGIQSIGDEVAFIRGDEEETKDLPPTPALETTTESSSSSSRNGSSESPTPEDTSPEPTSSAIPH